MASCRETESSTQFAQSAYTAVWCHAAVKEGKKPDNFLGAQKRFRRVSAASYLISQQLLMIYVVLSTQCFIQVDSMPAPEQPAMERAHPKRKRLPNSKD